MGQVGDISRRPTPFPIPQDIHGILPLCVQVGGVSIGGLWGAGFNAHQHPYSLRAPPHAVHDSYSGGR